MKPPKLQWDPQRNSALAKRTMEIPRQQEPAVTQTGPHLCLGRERPTPGVSPCLEG